MDTGADADGMNRHLNAAQVDVMKEFEAATRKCKQLLDDSATKYERLLEKYKALETSIKERDAKVTTSEERDASHDYVLVLIDAHDFELGRHEQVLSAHRGNLVALELNKMVATFMQAELPQHTSLRIDTKVFSAYQGLLDGLVEEGHYDPRMKDNHMLAHAEFAGGFSSTGLWYDFVETATVETMENKMICQFEWHVQDPRCKHIFFGGSGSPWYLETLREHANAHGKITHIRGEDINADIEALGLRTMTLSQFPDGVVQSLFWNGLHDGPATRPSYVLPQSDCATMGDTAPRSDISTPPASTKTVSRGCFKNNRYFPPGQTTEGKTSTASIVAKDKRASTQLLALPPPPHPGSIAINTKGQRLDNIYEVPTPAQFAAYKARVQRKKLCSSFYLINSCSVRKCRYDHGPITGAIVYVLRHRLLEWPCRYGGSCRRRDCYNGHICQKKGCMGSKADGCQFGPESHCVDMEVKEWVSPKEDVEKEKEVEVTQFSKKDTSKGSMENWPTMVGNLIDI